MIERKDRYILSEVQKQLAIDLNCSTEDFNKEGFIFCEAKDNPYRRPFPRSKSHFEMLTMGKSIIVSACLDILYFVKEQLQDKSRDDAFSMPFVYKKSI
ncbi:MAG: hypothetical protein FWC47_13460 [Oscillospiraceae bacterium]|nr:hypothetical protein [Oscillospiraceae bacterium]